MPGDAVGAGRYAADLAAVVDLPGVGVVPHWPAEAEGTQTVVGVVDVEIRPDAHARLPAVVNAPALALESDAVRGVVHGAPRGRDEWAACGAGAVDDLADPPADGDAEVVDPLGVAAVLRVVVDTQVDDLTVHPFHRVDGAAVVGPLGLGESDAVAELVEPRRVRGDVDRARVA